MQGSGLSSHGFGYGCVDACIRSAVHDLPMKFKLDSRSLLPVIFGVPLIVCGSGVEGLVDRALVKFIVISDHFVDSLLLFCFSAPLG